MQLLIPIRKSIFFFFFTVYDRFTELSVFRTKNIENYGSVIPDTFTERRHQAVCFFFNNYCDFPSKILTVQCQRVPIIVINDDGRREMEKKKKIPSETRNLARPPRWAIQ